MKIIFLLSPKMHVMFNTSNSDINEYNHTIFPSPWINQFHTKSELVVGTSIESEYGNLLSSSVDPSNICCTNS